MKLANKRILAVLAILLTISLPAMAGVGDIITLLNTITSTLRGEIGKVLGAIQTVKNAELRLKQEVVWPVAQINQAKNSVLEVRTQFTTLANRIQSIPVSSATLPNPKQLESLVRSGQSGNVGELGVSYQRLYGAVPLSGDATVKDRNLVDVDDATATGTLKTAIVSDVASQQMLGVADALEQQAASASPGSAPFLTAQAEVANLQNQAYLQRMLAAQLRQDAARLAHNNALVKQSAESVRGLRNATEQILNRR